MAKYPYTLKVGTLKKFLESIPSVGIPEKVTQNYLKSMNLKSSNDRTIMPVLKFLKFIDDAGIPTERYKQYRDKNKSKKVLGAAIRESYSTLFRQYPDADKKDQSTLQNFFSTHTGLGEVSVRCIVETFKGLSSFADIQGGEEIANDMVSEEITSTSADSSAYHNLNLSLTSGKKAKIIVPQDVTHEDIERLKKLLDVLK